MEEILEQNKVEEEEKKFEEGETRTPAEEETPSQGAPESDNIAQSEANPVDEAPIEPLQDQGNEEQLGNDAAQAPQENPVETEPPVEEPKEKMFTQSQVNEIVGNRIKEVKERMMKDLLERYGVSTEGEMDDIFGKGQIYADLYDENESGKVSLREANSKIALLESGIDPKRWDDVKAILGTKGREISGENIALELPTHPEWKGGTKGTLDEETIKSMASETGSVQEPTKPVVVTKIGADPSPKKEDTELEQAKALYGLAGLKGIK